MRAHPSPGLPPLRRRRAPARLTYIMRFKTKKVLSGEKEVAERFVYTRYFDTIAANRGGNVVDGLLSALEDK
jgi:ribosomal protein S7